MALLRGLGGWTLRRRVTTTTPIIKIVTNVHDIISSVCMDDLAVPLSEVFCGVRDGVARRSTTTAQISVARAGYGRGRTNLRSCDAANRMSSDVSFRWLPDTHYCSHVPRRTSRFERIGEPEGSRDCLSSSGGSEGGRRSFMSADAVAPVWGRAR